MRDWHEALTAGSSSPLLEQRILINMERIRIEQQGVVGVVWFGAWLFTIGFLHLSFWKGMLAIVLWPYYLGAMFGSLPQ